MPSKTFALVWSDNLNAQTGTVITPPYLIQSQDVRLRFTSIDSPAGDITGRELRLLISKGGPTGDVYVDITDDARFSKNLNVFDVDLTNEETTLVPDTYYVEVRHIENDNEHTIAKQVFTVLGSPVNSNVVPLPPIVLPLYKGGTGADMSDDAAGLVYKPLVGSTEFITLGIGAGLSVVAGNLVVTGGSVAWDDITGKPSTFPPSSHVHAGADITSGTINPARLGSGSSITTKFLRGDSTWQTVASGSFDPNAVYVLRFDGPPETKHVNHGLFGKKRVANVQQSAGTKFIWDCWARFRAGGYIVSFGYGGAHELLWGPSGVGPGSGIQGNVWNGTNLVSFTDGYSFASDEWLHTSVEWDEDDGKIYTGINGIPNRCTLFAGPRMCPGGTADGILFVAGSDHANDAMDIAVLRAFDQNNPHGAINPRGAFVPERFMFRTYFDIDNQPVHCDFFCDYTAVAGKTLLDTSPGGADSGGGFRTFHHGTLGNDTERAGAGAELPFPVTSAVAASNYPPPWAKDPVPYWVEDPTCPYGRVLGTSPAPTELTRTPLSVPSGALAFDSFQRANQTWAFQEFPTLGSTEGGSLGVLEWQQGSPGIPNPLGSAPNGCRWGLLGGRAVMIGLGNAIAWVDIGTETQDVRITRAAYQAGTPGTDGFTYESGDTCVAFRVVDENNYWCFAFASPAAGPREANGSWSLCVVEDGVITTVASGSVTLGALLTLRVTTSANSIKCYYGTDGVPGTWTQVGTTVSSAVHNTATGAGIATTFGESTYLDPFARFLNFTAFDGPEPGGGGPGELPYSTGLDIWLKADAGLFQTVGGAAATADGDPVGEWQDQSGNNRHFSQATSGRRPTLKLNINNSMPAIRFGGAHGVELTGYQAFPSKRGTMFAVYKNTAGVAAVMSNAFSVTEVDYVWYSAVSGTAYKWYDHASNHVGAAVDPAGFFQRCMRRTSNTALESYLNGTLLTTFTIADNQPSAAIPTRVGTDDSYSSLPLVGDILELIVFDHSIPDQAVTDITDYLQTRHALP